MPVSTRRIALFALMTAVSFGLSLPAHADKGGKGHGKDKGESHREWRDHDDDGDHRRSGGVIVIDPRDRVVISNYIEHDFDRHCPPGLAKKHNGCMPPGQAKKYRVGSVLPPDVVYYPVPRDLLIELAPVPAGYQYVQVDKDILLIGEASKKVIDAVTLLSAVGQ